MQHLTQVSEQMVQQVAKEATCNTPREVLKSYMQTTGMDEKAMSVALRLNGRQQEGMLTNYLNEVRGATNLDELVQSFFQMADFSIKPTTNLGIVFKVCDHAKRRKAINGIAGRSGYGKSVGLIAYARSRGAIYYAHDKCSTHRDFLISLLWAAGVPNARIGQSGELRRRLVNRLVELGRPLIILDEADTLPFKSVEVARSINDQVQGGMIMAGIDPYLQQMLLRPGHGRRPEQAAGRVAAIVRLPDPNLDDVSQIAGDFGVKAHKSLSFLLDRGLVTGGYRRVRMLLEDGKEVAQEASLNSITFAALNEAAAYLPEETARQGGIR